MSGYPGVPATEVAAARDALGLVNDVASFSAVDGPGNRFVVFLQGCNFDCIACHNPQTITPCIACGLCIEPCPEDALALVEGGRPRMVVDWEACTRCGICIDVCPEDSTPLAATTSVGEVVDQIRNVAPFLSGVTVTGGEPTQQWEFVAELFRALETDPELSRLSRFVDSNGAAPDEVWATLDPVMDGAMIDLKSLDDGAHRSMTGSSNGQVLASIEQLHALGKLYEVRLLVVPGRNDGPGVMERTARWLHRIDPAVRVRLIAFRRLGVRAPFTDIEEPGADAMAAHAAALRAGGLSDVVVT